MWLALNLFIFIFFFFFLYFFLTNNFYLFIYFSFFFIIFSSLGIIFARNPVQSVFYLILVYIFTAITFSYMGAEFLALLIFMVYVGAVSVLFLFCIMLLDLRYIEILDSYRLFFPVGMILGFIFFLEIFFWLSKGFSLNISPFFFECFDFVYLEKISLMNSQLHNFGYILYEYNWFFVIIITVLLLSSMIGSIIFSLETVVLKKKIEYEHKIVPWDFLKVQKINLIRLNR